MCARVVLRVGRPVMSFETFDFAIGHAADLANGFEITIKVLNTFPPFLYVLWGHVGSEFLKSVAAPLQFCQVFNLICELLL